MDFLLITSDANLSRLCREVITTVGGRNWTLSTCEPGDSIPTSDLYLWDVEANFLPGLAVNRAAESLFFAHSKDVIALQKAIGPDEANILLKPVTRAVLRAYLTLLLNIRQDCDSRNNSLRADRDAMLQGLIQANLRLQEYDQERTNFLVRAIHDFRAPLTALSGYCGLLLNEAVGELTAEQAEVIRRMQHSANRLTRMANGMFELGISRRIQRSPELRRADIRECVEQATHEIAPFIRDKQISISSEMSPAPTSLYFDVGQIEQLLVNLLDNACKFVPRGGSIQLKGYPYFMEQRDGRQITPGLRDRRSQTSDEPNTYRIDIHDSGSFIPQEQLESIFEEYTSSSVKQDRSGGGLGLAICRFIVQQHGGRIWAANSESGPMFSFTLPLRGAYSLERDAAGQIPTLAEV
jgi:signal transduction histidine kinase